MSMKIDRFELIDVTGMRTYSKGIKDHSDDRLIVLLNTIVDDKVTERIGEEIISVIENIIGEEENDP